jgi:hypothetical protein
MLPKGPESDGCRIAPRAGADPNTNHAMYFGELKVRELRVLS